MRLLTNVHSKPANALKRSCRLHHGVVPGTSASTTSSRSFAKTNLKQDQPQASICVSAQTEMACPLIVRPRSEAMKTIWSAICCGVT